MLKGKCAIVTGSTSGIGQGIARALAAQGCSVMLNGLGDSQAIEQDRAALETAAGVKVLYHPADMTDPAQIADLVDTTERELGSVDILVNNAGIQFTAPVEQFPPDRWNSIIAINLTSAFHTTRLALPKMRARNWGRIINVASVHGLVASVHKAAYVAAKHGLIGLTKVVALETAESNITCNAICPGWVRTPLVEAQIDALAKRDNITTDEAAVKLLEEKQPSKRFVEIDQLGAITVFLCSEAAANVTGVSLPVDGGWTAR
ncbi:MAG TPA: 3-hydroxybutyrate dehydrogenase [Candidatus Obscuribacterales bacterium]